MHTYYLFSINECFYDLYYDKPFYLYKRFYEISKSSKKDLLINSKNYYQMINILDKSSINKFLYKKYSLNKNYEKVYNRHILKTNNKYEKLYIYNTYIKIKTNKMLIRFINALKDNKNYFVCDFSCNDYFWINDVFSK